MTPTRRPTSSIDVLSPREVSQVFESLGEYIAIHEPMLDEFGAVKDASLIWWNQGYEEVRVLPVETNSKMSDAYFDPEVALEYVNAAWSAGRAVQLFEFTPARLSRYRPPGSVMVISVMWERVGDFIIEIGSDLTEVRELENKLADQRSLVFAKERERTLLAERERIARNLHDTVIQQIYASSLGLNAVAARLRKNEPLDAETLDRMARGAKDIADNLSELIATIRNEIFDVRRLSTRSLRQDLEETVLPIIGPTSVKFHTSIQIETLDDQELVSHLRAVVREAISNAVRHSQCERVELSVHRMTDGFLHVVITDNGVGLSESAARGSGLTNIEERTKALGGRVRFVSEPHGGTTVDWQVPVAEWRS